MKTLIKNATIVNEQEIYKADLLIDGEIIKKISRHSNDQTNNNIESNHTDIDLRIDAEGLYLLPGMIDDQVHFRDPGLTHKGDLYTESRAAVAGGTTSFMEMPNTVPRCLTQELLEDKYKIAAEKSYANYSFYMGTANDNLEEVLKTDPKKHCGIKIFLGASTGNMLVNNQEVIRRVLEYSAQTDLIVTVHSEDEETIQANAKHYKEKYGDNIPVTEHPNLRSREACYICTEKIVNLAKETGGNLHVLHLSTADEMIFFEKKPLAEKKITAELCVHHMWFTDEDYKTRGAFIKWNPAIKSAKDRTALRTALKEGRIDIIATDHAPHTIEEKLNDNYFKSAAGGPLVQHALVACLELYHQGIFSLEEIVEKTSHNIAIRFKLAERGYIREGYKADLVLVDLNSKWTVTKENILYKCGWSPFEGHEFKSSIQKTFVNGTLVYDNGKLTELKASQRLEFNR
jgi:dihydroorotase